MTIIKNCIGLPNGYYWNGEDSGCSAHILPVVDTPAKPITLSAPLVAKFYSNDAVVTNGVVTSFVCDNNPDYTFNEHYRTATDTRNTISKKSYSLNPSLSMVHFPELYPSNNYDYKGQTLFRRSVSNFTVNGFICVINPLLTLDEMDRPEYLSYLLSGSPPNGNANCFRGPIRNNVKDSSDIDGISGSIHINGKLSTTYNNVGKNTVMYVKFTSTKTLQGIGFSSVYVRGGYYCSYKGDIGDFFFLSPNHTDSDRDILEGYLAWKWGLNGNLPNVHKYYKFAPNVIL